MRPDIDTWALDLSEVVARRSRDPNTQVGAVILRADNTVASVGYNGFPRGTNDAQIDRFQLGEPGRLFRGPERRYELGPRP